MSDLRKTSSVLDNWAGAQECEFRLSSSEVHVWKVPVAGRSNISELIRCLTNDEIDRAQRFQRRVIGSRFIKRRAALRYLLAWYLETQPESIRFEHNKFGKPHVVDGGNGRQIQFSSSSSENLALISVTLENDIGCDVENRNRKVEFLSLAKRFFHPGETADLHSQNAPDQRSAFFHCWARKEAYIKALGKGLFLPLDSFRVNILPDQPKLLWADSNVTDSGKWTMRSLAPDADYVGALLTPKNVNQIRRFEFSWKS